MHINGFDMSSSFHFCLSKIIENFVGKLLDFFWKSEEREKGLGSRWNGKGCVAEGIRTVVGWLTWEVRF